MEPCSEEAAEEVLKAEQVQSFSRPSRLLQPPLPPLAYYIMATALKDEVGQHCPGPFLTYSSFKKMKEKPR